MSPPVTVGPLAFLDAVQLVVILRGVTAAEVPALAEALIEAGIRCLEVPLTGPAAHDAVAALVAAADGRALVGAGTVLTPEHVDRVADLGAGLVVSPNLDAAVVARTKERGLVSMPGVATPTEAFAALAAGADVLKLFPGEALPPPVVRAWRAVLPTARLYPTGGVTLDTMAGWRAAGASGFGVGTAIWRPGRTPTEAAEAAAKFVGAIAR